MREREEVKKGGKEAAGACVSLSLRDFFGKKKIQKNKNCLHCMSYGAGEKTNKIIY